MIGGVRVPTKVYFSLATLAAESRKYNARPYDVTKAKVILQVCILLISKNNLLCVPNVDKYFMLLWLGGIPEFVENAKERARKKMAELWC